MPEGILTPAEAMTEEQIANWRKALIGLVGPHALLMSKEQIQAHRDRFQARLDKEVSNDPEQD